MRKVFVGALVAVYASFCVAAPSFAQNSGVYIGRDNNGTVNMPQPRSRAEQLEIDARANGRRNTEKTARCDSCCNRVVAQSRSQFMGARLGECIDECVSGGNGYRSFAQCN